MRELLDIEDQIVATGLNRTSANRVEGTAWIPGTSPTGLFIDPSDAAPNGETGNGEQTEDDPEDFEVAGGLRDLDGSGENVGMTVGEIISE